MDITELWQFFIMHWVLSSCLLGLLIIILFYEIRHLAQWRLEVDISTMINKFNHERAILLDIRDQNNFNQAHIPGAINIPLAQIKLKPNLLNPYRQKSIVIICYKGISSIALAHNLDKTQRYKELNILKGGMNTWHQAQMPTEGSEG